MGWGSVESMNSVDLMPLSGHGLGLEGGVEYGSGLGFGSPQGSGLDQGSGLRIGRLVG